MHELFPEDRSGRQQEIEDHQDQQELDADQGDVAEQALEQRSEEHTSELQSLMRISYAVFCLKKKTQARPTQTHGTPISETIATNNYTITINHIITHIKQML